MMTHKTTPLMAQYYAIKDQYPDALVCFQVGDFYELFHDDAKKAAHFLGITLTKRGKDQGVDIPLCGVPVHMVNHYVGKLVKGGFSVVICDQLEEPKPGSLVRRGVTQVLTPGTLTEDAFLDEKSSCYLGTLVPDQEHWAFVFAELLTAQVYATTCKAGDYKVLETELARFFPQELVIDQAMHNHPMVQALQKQGYFISLVHASQELVSYDIAVQEKINAVVHAQQALQHAVTTFYSYMHTHHPEAVSLFTTLHVYASDDYLMIDQATQHNLELVTNTYDGSRNHSLYAMLDATVTGMGARMLQKWLVRPLLDRMHISHRHDAVQYYQERYVLLQESKKVIQSIGDIERVVGRIALQRASYNDYKHLLRMCVALPTVRTLFAHDMPALLQSMYDATHGFESLTSLLQQALYDESEYEWIIKTGYNTELDQMRSLMLNSQQALLDLEQQEQRSTGIGSLKIRYNSLYGYYIEITKANTHLVPEHYTKRHSLVGKDRFTCQALQLLEQKITTAQRDAHSKEKELYEQVCSEINRYVPRLRKLAAMIAQWDVVLSFAHTAVIHQYVRPELSCDAQTVTIIDGRHPVVERLVVSGFVANDTQLTSTQKTWIITGPNMGGKSTYLRQVALMHIMAQAGSFVPAKKAQLPIVDRIFTRIGAGDHVASGKSTFLVEMEETADICRYATEKSLVILDEVGRGTSTQDGIALAQAIIEYLSLVVKPWCLFATHYHELTNLAHTMPTLATYYTASKETEQGIVFLHRLLPGVAHKSFGLEVAKRAHLPQQILTRAQWLVAQHTSTPTNTEKQMTVTSIDAHEINALRERMVLLEKKLSIFKELESLDVLELTPKKAFDVVWKLRSESVL